MEELAEPRPAYVLTRGRYDAPKTDDKRVQRATPWFACLSKQCPANRLGLAMWLTDPHHPLTARVVVNRYWQMFLAGASSRQRKILARKERNRLILNCWIGWRAISLTPVGM